MKRYLKGWMTTLAALLLATAAHAATYYVDVNYDGVNGISDGTIGKPWTRLGDAVPSFTASSGHTVLVAGGVYKSTAAGGLETFGTTGYALNPGEAQNRVGAWKGGYGGVASDGSYDWSEASRVFPTAAADTAGMTVIDLTNANARAFYASSYQHTFTFDGLRFQNSDVAQSIYNGGALYNAGGMNASVLYNCVFLNNRTTGDGGGAWFGGRGSTSTNLLFVNNTAGRDGGGAFVQAGNTGQNLTDCRFEGNAAARHGGGLCTGGSQTFILTRCNFVSNEAVSVGGAIGVGSRSALLGRQSRYVWNTAARGSAIADVNTNDGITIDLVNCLVADNVATGTGYALYTSGAADSAAVITLRHTTVSGNALGGIYLHYGRTNERPVFQIDNTIIVSNGTPGVYCSFPVGTLAKYGDALGRPRINHSVVFGHTADITWAGEAGTTCVTNNVLSVDPQFADASNGDYTLTKTSPCVDAAANLGIAADLVGTPRPTRNGYDMGCYEESQVARVRNLAPVVGTTSAWLRGSLDYDAGVSCGVYIYWGSADGDTDKSGWAEIHVGDQNVGEFQTEITGLTPGTEYFFRCLASNAYDEAWADAAASFTTFSGSGVNRLWTGAGGNALASTAANWFGGTAPSSDDFIVLDSAPSNLTWDAAAPQTVAGWTQTENYTGTVTFNTVYGSSGFTVFTVTGDATVMGGSWRHAGNSIAEIYRLKAAIGGALTLGSQAAINVEGLGYAISQGPGRGNRNLPNQGASHGGLGGMLSGSAQPTAYYLTYGAITEPVHLGSGGNNGAGGGAVYLVVGGTAMIEGTISANAPTVSGETMGSGGSVYLRASDVASSGATISARGGVSTGNVGFSTGGGGGRIAVVLDSGTAIDPDLVFDARGGTGTQGNKSSASAGTIYLQTASQSAGGGTLVIDNFGVTTYGLTTTLQTPATDYTAFDAIIVRGRGRLGLDANDTFDFGAGALAGAGRDAAEVVIRSVGTLTFPSSFTISGYSLCADALASLTADVTVAADGRLTHSGHLAPHLFKLNLALTGNLTVQAGGEVSGQTRGYEPATGPGTGDRADYGASHGGLGGVIRTDVLGNPSFQTYGSLLDPTDLGSGGSATPGGFGGGAVRLVVSGDVVLDGSMTVLGQSETASGAGGSVSLSCRTLSGAGLIDASGPTSDSSSGDRVGAGGGRVAVKLTHGADVGGVSLRAFGGRVTTTTTRDGSAGTAYLETAAQAGGRGVLMVRNTTSHSVHASSFTPIPHRTAAFTDDLKKATLRIEDRGRVGLMADTTVGDVVIVGNGYLQTGAFKLYVDALEHHLDDPSKKGMGPTTMVDNYANIVWTGKSPGTLILLR